MVSQVASRFPIARSPPSVRYRDDQDAALFNSIDHAEREPSQKVATGSPLISRPGLRQTDDGRLGRVYFFAECGRRCRAALCVPSRSRFCLSERFFKVLKVASHGRPPRGCVDAPPTMESLWRYQSRLDRGGLESRPTRPLQRRRLLQSPDCELAPQRARPVLRRRAGALRPRAASHPYQDSSTPGGLACLSAGDSVTDVSSNLEIHYPEMSSRERRQTPRLTRLAAWTHFGRSGRMPKGRPLL